MNYDKVGPKIQSSTELQRTTKIRVKSLIKDECVQLKEISVKCGIFLPGIDHGMTRLLISPTNCVDIAGFLEKYFTFHGNVLKQDIDFL